MITRKVKYLFLASAFLFTVSCEEFANVEPFVYNLVSVDTDSKGNFYQIRDDYGKVLAITANECETDGNTPDSTYRMICNYIEYEDNTALLNSVNEIISCIARPLSYFDGHEIKKDPLDVQSFWVSGGYLNIVLEIKGLNKPHSLSPIDYSTDTEVIFGFYHDHNSDVQSYTKNAYVSIPLWPYPFLQQGDIIQFSVMDYDGEEKTYRLEYK